MSTRTNKGYLWVFDQQDKWDDIITEKIEQLDDIANTHLDWFEKHSTASDLISWKRPVLNSKKIKKVCSADFSQNKTQSESRESNSKESNLELDSDIQTRQPDSITEEAEHDTRVADSTDVKLMTIAKSFQTIDQLNQVESPERLSFSAITENNDNDIKSNESVISNSIPPPRPSRVGTEHNDEQLTPKTSELVADVGDSDNQTTTSENHSSIPIFRQEYNEVEDEVQLVVSTRNFQREIEQHQKTNVARKVPSPIKPPSRSMIAGPTIARHQSSFMSRLFKMGRPSISKSKRDPPLPTDMITTKRPSLDSVKSDTTVIPVVGSIVHTIDQPSQDIEVSQFMPTSGPRLKRKKLLITSPVKSAASDSIPNQPSTINEDESEETNSFKIPDWAKSPELRLHIQRQEGLDPDKIFGSVPPFQIRDIFPPSKQYVGEIPNHAPE